MTTPLNICHVGVVLRSILWVHGVMATAMLFGALTWQAWLGSFSQGAGVALPAVLLWLMLVCGLKRWLARLAWRWQWVVATGLGGLSGAFGHGLMALPMAGERGLGQGWVAPVVAGMALACSLFYGLALKARTRSPADVRARLAELQSRIRPHFLFNALNTAMALVQLDPARAQAVLADLAELFRVALNETGESVSLDDEVALAQRYLAIEQIRFGERLQLRWQLAPGAGMARVPALLLQPLVENAVRHGVEPCAQGAQVTIKTQVRHGSAIITITNTLSPHPSVPGHGMALNNVRERLALMHDLAAQFDVHHDRTHFRVRMVVPL